MNYIGIDIGSTASKICILRENGEPEFKVMPTGWNSKITRIAGLWPPGTGGFPWTTRTR